MSPSCWTGFGLPSFLVMDFFFVNAQKCLCMKHHNRGDELDQSHTAVASLCNQIKHTGGGNDVVPLLSKPLFSLTAVWSDHNGQMDDGQHLKPSRPRPANDAA